MTTIKRTIEEKGYKVSAIEGFETEFERQVSYLIASAINREHEYNEGYVKWTANALLNYAKHELEKQGEPTYIPADAVLDSNKDGLIADTIRYKREKQGEQKPAAWSEKDAFIEKACEWLKKNVTYTHPRKGTTECIVNLNAFKEAMSNNTMSYKCKLDKIIDTVVWYIHLRNEGMISGTCGDFESLLKEIDSVINNK